MNYKHFIDKPFASFSLIMLCFIFMTSCSKNELPEDAISYTYSETQCADPWHMAEDAFDVTPEERVMAYFNASDLKIYNVEFIPLTEDLLVCHACTCPSGNLINIEVAPESVEAIENLGFTVAID